MRIATPAMRAPARPNSIRIIVLERLMPSTSSISKTPSVGEAKDLARKLRSLRLRRGRPITQSAALERIARRWGWRNWNTFRAAAAPVDRRAPARHGAQVSGRYLGRPFTGRVLRVAAADDGWRVTIAFDAPVDVSTTRKLVVERRRVSALLDAAGVAYAQTSDGRPHLVLAGDAAAR